MTLSMFDILQTVNKGLARIEAHIGANGDAHLAATQDSAGFMSADDKGNLDMRCRYAMTKGDKSDVLAIEAGIFVGRDWVNRPSAVDDSLCLVEVTGASHGQYKHIDFYWLSAGKHYWRDVYTNLDTSWIDGSWTDLTLNTGWAGYARVKLERLGASTLVEIKYEANKSSDIESGDVFATLGIGNSLTEAKPLYTTATAVVKGTTQTTLCSVVIQGTKALTIYRTNQNQSITGVMGHIIYTR